MSDRTKVAAQAKNIVLVPLNRLKKSPKNVPLRCGQAVLERRLLWIREFESSMGPSINN